MAMLTEIALLSSNNMLLCLYTLTVIWARAYKMTPRFSMALKGHYRVVLTKLFSKLRILHSIGLKDHYFLWIWNTSLRKWLGNGISMTFLLSYLFAYVNWSNKTPTFSILEEVLNWSDITYCVFADNPYVFEQTSLTAAEFFINHSKTS